ncbi:MAG: HpcH/HpaI aldolase family protein [Terriglobales bacterium]
MQRNSVKEKLKAGDCVYGTSLEDCLDAEIAVLLAAAGFDFFFVDTEHCPASYAQIQALCRSGRGAGIIPLVRVTQNEPDLISRALDVGAMGVIVPRVHSAEQARAALDVMKFPPLGHRGFGLRSTVTDFRGGAASDEVKSANQETLAVLMIESKEGLESVEAIAATPNLDVLFIGPYDLSLSLGIVEEFDNPVFWQAVERVIAACRKAGIATGLQSGNIEIALKARSLGARLIIYGSDVSVLFQGYRDAMARLKGELPDSRVSYP